MNEGYDFNMVLVVVSDDKKADVSADIDLTKYDAAIIAEQFAGDAAALMADGPLAIAKLNNKAVEDVGIAGVWYNAANIDEQKDKNIFYMG